MTTIRSQPGSRLFWRGAVGFRAALALGSLLMATGTAASDLRVGVNIFDASELPPGWQSLPISWYKDFGALGPTLERDGTRLDYVPILTWQGASENFLRRWLVNALFRRGILSNPAQHSFEDFRDLNELNRLEARLRADRARLPAGTLFLVGIEPGYRPNGDTRNPEQIVADAARLHEVLTAIDPSYRIGLGGISTARTDFVADAYGMTGNDFLERVLDQPRNFAFDAFVIHPYPSTPAAPSADESLDQIRAFRRILAERGLRDTELIVGEIGTAFSATPLADAVAYTEAMVRGMLTTRDPAIGHPGDGDRLVQRFTWFLLVPPSREVPGITDNPILDLSRSALLDRQGQLTPVGEAFVRGVAAGRTEPD